MPRTAPPAALSVEIDRPRLIELLDSRWVQHTTVLRAGPGAGKTTVLAQAVRANRQAPRGVDVWLTCTPADVDQTRLTKGLYEALGIEGSTNDADSTSDIALRVVDTIASRSPTHVCIVLDDVHKVVPGSGGAELLRRIQEEAPPNLSMVFATRDETPVPLARQRAAGQAVFIDGTDELYFDADERREIADAIGADEQLDSFEGWPALTVLAAAFGVDAAKEFVFEEVLVGLEPDELLALEALATAGEMSLADVSTLGLGGAATIDRLAQLPLVRRDGDNIVVHDLLGGAVRDLMGLGNHDETAPQVIDMLLARGDEDAALTEALASGATAKVADILIAAVARTVPTFPSDTAERWEAMLGDLPDSGERQLMRVAARLPMPDPLAVLDGVLAEFEADGKDEAVLTALAVMAYQAYNLGDFGRLLSVQQRLETMGDTLGGFLASVRSAVRAVMADLGGDPAASLAHLDSIDQATLPPELRLQLARLKVVNLITLGRADEAVPFADAELAGSPDPQIASTAATARWFAGDPSAVADLDDGDGGGQELDGIEGHIVASLRAHLTAAFGRSMQTPMPVTTLSDPPRIRTMAAVTDAVVTLIGDGESVAANRLAAALASIDVTDQSVQHELRRFLAVPVLLAPDALDMNQPLGPAHRRVCDVAETLLSLRAHPRLAPSEQFDGDTILTALPLPWSAELLARAHATGAAWAVPAATAIIDVVGRQLTDQLLKAASADSGWSGAAASLLPQLTNPPEDRLRVEVLGPMRLLRGDEVVDDPLLRRRRVRELVAALVTTAELTRDQLAELMWPEATAKSATQSLRTNLSHVRRLLEPALSGRQKSYFLRAVGDSMTLMGTGLTTDLWDFDRLIDLGRSADTAGNIDAALDAFAEAVELWRGEPIVDHPGDATSRTESLRREARHAAVRASELSLARRQFDRARSFADRALVIDPYDPAAHAARLACELVAGRVDEVERLLEAIDAGVSEGLLYLVDEAEMVVLRARDLLARHRVDGISQ